MKLAKEEKYAPWISDAAPVPQLIYGEFGNFCLILLGTTHRGKK